MTAQPRTQSRDTSPEAEARQIEAWRAMTPAQKAHLVSELVRTTERLARAGVRLRHPNADEREIGLRLMALRLDRATMIRFLDWDPEREGY